MQAASCLQEGEYCRLIRVSVIIVGLICTTSFKVKFGRNLGKQGHSPSENLFRPSQRKDCFGVVSADICKEVGLPFAYFMQCSDRVCNPRGRTIRNLGQFY